MSPTTLKRIRNLGGLTALSLALAAPAFAAPVPTMTLKNPTPMQKPTPPATGTFKLPQPTDVLLNGNGDATTGADGSGQTVCPVHWSCTRQFTVVKYGVEDFPTSSSAGPADRGANMFAGGNEGPDSQATQTVDLRSFSGRISSGQATFTLSGYLGGWDDQNDHTVVSVEFFDSSNHSLGAPTSLQTVTPGDRNGVRGFVERTATGSVPTGTASAKVTIAATEDNGGYNDGYADSLHLIIN